MFPCSFIILALTARFLVLSGDIFYVSFSIILFLFRNGVSVDWNVLQLITKFQSKGNRKVCLPTLTLASLPIELTHLKQSTAHKSRSTNSSTTGTWKGFIRRLLCGNFWCKEEEVEAETSLSSRRLKTWRVRAREPSMQERWKSANPLKLKRRFWGEKWIRNV